MHTNVKKVKKIMEHIAPTYLAEKWDNVGLLVGNENKMVENILLALDVTDEVIADAVDKNVDLIITHHPLIFKPLKRITTNDPVSKMVINLIKNDINLYVAHTNLDSAKEGTCEYIAKLMNLSNVKVLEESHTDTYYKVIITVPIEQTKQVRDAMTSSGAGHIGDYSDCTFNSFGSGTFRPGSGANPFIGEAGELETVDEFKVESIVHQNDLNNVLTNMIKAHPYEVPAYDVIKLENKIDSYGIGRTGRLDKRVTLQELAEQVKELLNTKQVKIIGDLNKKVNNVSVVTGAGSDYLKVAARKSEVLITGDMKYHEAQLAEQLGLCVIDAGHFETESIYMNRLKEMLDSEFEQKSYDINVIVSDIDINPFNIL